MLSAFSSFIPSALSDRLDRLDLRSNNDASNKQDADIQQHTDDDDVKPVDVAEESNKKEKKKKNSSHEASGRSVGSSCTHVSHQTFIVVRPPPAKSNHPLNLQLQLVPAHNPRDRSNSSATAATPTNNRSFTDLGIDSARPPSSPSTSESEHALKRTPSVRSNRSDTSGFYASSSAAATGSVTSFASTASTASGRRMIIPLYNLSAHNVMPNTILDAGTDARVAKFHKRGLEIVDLAILEPTEVWCGKEHTHGAGVGASSDPLGIPIRRSISGSSSLAPPVQNGSRAGTPDPSQSPASSRLSISSDHSGIAPTNDPISTPTATPTGAKKVFSKIFRKRQPSNNHSPSISVSTVGSSPPKSTSPIPETRTVVPSRPQLPTEVLLPAVLGLSPTLSAATNPPTGRCVSYVWNIRKWLKTDTHGLISGVLGKISKEASVYGIGNGTTPNGGGWEVRFEWMRGGKRKGEKARRANRRLSMDVGAATARSRSPQPSSSRRQSAVIGVEEEVEELGEIHEGAGSTSFSNDGPSISIDSPRPSLNVHRPGSPRSRTPSPRAVGALEAPSLRSTGHSDDEDESDPEDSETPWTCSMVLRYEGVGMGMGSGVGVENQTTPTAAGMQMSGVKHLSTPHLHSHSHAPVKIKVATLSPAPHHPKVVCQLKIPFPLPDAEVGTGALWKRVVLADGTTRSTIPIDRGTGLTLTAEEIKDVVCSTAFWVVAREGIGGVGKKSRKGDGWKIRG